MQTMNIQKEVIDLIADQLDIKTEKIKTEQKLIEDLKADSLDVVELVLSFEEKFNISIPDETAESLQKVQDIIDYISKEKKV